ncbi:hypothetical protein [Virgibacillus dokdonensis]|nr:hypothetical protein [Virgibacillus dokdonensis]
MATTFEIVLAVSCIISAYVGYSFGEYSAKRNIKEIVKQTLKEKDDK